MRGRVIRISRKGGYAFVIGEDDELSRFAHVSAFISQADFDKLREDELVEFTPSHNPSDPSKLRAVEVRRVSA